MATLDITKIPSVMRANRWERGARLMEKWFNDPANTVPANGIASNGIVTMDWVLAFARAREVYDKLVAERIWLNEAARRRSSSFSPERTHLELPSNGFCCPGCS